MLPITPTTAKFAKGAAIGVYEGGRATVTGIADALQGLWGIASDPAKAEQAWQTTKQVAGAVSDYAGAAYDDPTTAIRNAKDGVNRLYSEFDTARQAAEARGETAEFWGKAWGRGAFEVGALLVPVGALTKAGKLTKGAKALDTVADGGKAAARASEVLAKGATTADKAIDLLPCEKAIKATKVAAKTSLLRVPTSGVPIVADPKRTTTILGKFGPDMEPIIKELDVGKSVNFGPKTGGFNVLNVPDHLNRNPDQFWNEFNRPFLDEAIARGDKIQMATRPTSNMLDNVLPDGTIVRSGFGREFDHLRAAGYSYDELSSTMIKGN